MRTFEFGGAFPGVANPYVGIDFLINNMQYQETAVPTIVNRGDAEEWHLVVEGAHHGGTEGHPFHIHVNSFEVISVGGAAQPPGTIMDTIWIPQDTIVVIRMKLRAVARQVGVPLPHPAARGHRHDAELPDRRPGRPRPPLAGAGSAVSRRCPPARS